MSTLAARLKCALRGHVWRKSATRPGHKTCARCGVRRKRETLGEAGQVTTKTLVEPKITPGPAGTKTAAVFHPWRFLKCLRTSHDWANSHTHRGFMTCKKCGLRRRY